MRPTFRLLTVSLLLLSCHASADEAVASKMRALFPKADADQSGTLSEAEQARAVEFVKTTYGGQWSRQIEVMFGRAGKDGTVSAEAWQRAVAMFAQAPAKKTEMIAMRDGVPLATDLFLPSGDGPFPVVLSRTPYSRVKRSQEAASFVREGWVFVIQDMRGRFDSKGENLPFIGCGWGEHEDGVDTIEWLKKQPWCNGSIVTIGGSAGGITQNLLAGAAPQGLMAQYISVATSSMYAGGSYIGGAFRKADVENWMTGNKYDPQALQITRDHPNDDDYWAKFDTTKRFDRMNVPAVHVGGWFDMFLQGTIDQFTGRQHHGAPGAKGTQKLVIGPWQHAIGKMPAGQLNFPNATRIPQAYDALRWFTHYLNGTDNGIEKEPAVAYYVMGDTATPGAPGNEWRYANDWPIPAKETPVYLTGERRLSLEKPAAATTPHEFTFDPANPCPTIGGANLTIDRGPMDQRKIENRGDVLVFTSDVLDKPVEVTGRVLAKIFISSSAVDTDLSVRLCDVYPDGRSMLIAEGMQRLRHRQSTAQPVPLTPGQIEEVTVDCWSTSQIFNIGHRIRVTITSSNYPRFDVNPGTGQPWSDTGEQVKQTNRIYCDTEHTSRLVVPVVE
ncbi:MAG: CocE/NonD family hydrolase [Prosthecobacter sp.]|jgi:predicted acyl esterase|uniref:CocE/NonD family hydrolase n=1 Tax=Prosthecobacter sp. TaxID=1965333 RepID=UPI0019FC7F81|nr:CocE/NonD family hydrolase [Prosthecobacter sp.]MBE2287890.1 CocE/NonD family hydrolase [Prosthecobacter sp.]